MAEEGKKITAGILALFIIVAGFFVFSTETGSENPFPFETGTATIDDLLASSSERNLVNATIVASDKNPYYALLGTSPALYYVGTEMRVNPLLVVKSENPSSAVLRFLNYYMLQDIISIGEVNGLPIQSNMTFEEESLRLTSLEVARYFWQSSDGVILIREGQDGYNFAVSIMPLASYLNIPVIIVDNHDYLNKKSSEVAVVLSELGVKYSIIAGESSGYGKTMRFKNIEEIQDIVIQIVEQKLKGNVSYITMANPMDIARGEVVDTYPRQHFEGTIKSSADTPYPGVPESASATDPMHNFTIPYQYANVKIDIKMDLSEVGLDPYTGMVYTNDADFSGERIYVYIGIDNNSDGIIGGKGGEDQLDFFGGSPGYDFIRENPNDQFSRPLYAHFYTEIPFFNQQGERQFQLTASLVTDKDGESTYTVDIIVENLSSPVYPLLPGASSLAGYLTAYHRGVVLADKDFTIYTAGYIGCKDCGDPASNSNLIETTNAHVGKIIKNDLNNLLGRLAEKPTATKEDIIALAEYYKGVDVKSLPHIGIIADTNMVPHFYYESSGQGSSALEGFGLPSDNIYADIDADPEDPPFSLNGELPSMELPIGRIHGWDTQDVSSLIARTVFYDDIIDKHLGPKNNGVNLAFEWKNSAMGSIGSVVPVEAAITTSTKLQAMMSEAGFRFDNTRHNELSRRNYNPGYEAGIITGAKGEGAYQWYESSNFIMACAHGFYYWYVPTAQEGAYLGIVPKIYGGGAFDVIHVKDMNFGPSVIFLSSCVTGRIDGILPRIALSQAFLHAGVNTYIGATRMSWGTLVPIPDDQSGELFGDYIALMLYGHLTGYIYDKRGGLITGYEPSNTTVGVALMLAKNSYVEKHGSDNGGPHDDTVEEFIIHGDPAFNPYEPNHEGSRKV